VEAWAPQLHTLAWGDGLGPALAEATLVVNTTPVGMASASDPQAALGCPLQPAQLDALLLRQAEARGCTTLDGLEMLVEQGAAALRLWSGRREVPVAVMRQALLEWLP
jgi:shikimate dehydrogenase